MAENFQLFTETLWGQRNRFPLPPNNTVATIRSDERNLCKKKRKRQAMELLRIYTLKREKKFESCFVLCFFFFIFLLSYCGRGIYLEIPFFLKS